MVSRFQRRLIFKLYYMRSNVLFMIVCILSFLLSACDKDNNRTILPEGDLSVVRISDMNIESAEKYLFTIRDIQTFDKDNGKLTFNDMSVVDLKEIVNEVDTLVYFIGDELLFNSMSIVPEHSSAVYNTLSLILTDSGCYLKDGYPSLDILHDNFQEYRDDREQNNLSRKNEWEIFIKYLEEKGKIVK